jgi:CDP-diacylglycerol pyrophosphatase
MRIWWYTLGAIGHRSQNQLHIHISCIRPDVKKLIHNNGAFIVNKWEIFPSGILNHPYYSRRINKEQLKNVNLFALLKDELPDATNNMKDFTMAVIADNKNFIILADKYNPEKGDRAWAEEVQDHDCPQLNFH